MYKLLRNILFLFPAESVHHFSMKSLKLICKVGFLKKLIASQFTINDQRFTKELFGLSFKNPIGLAAEFKKTEVYLIDLETLGFGLVKKETETPLPKAEKKN